MESPLETCNRKRITLAQKSLIVSFMEKNPQFHMGKFGPFFTLQDRNRMWEELAKELNSNGGAVKDVNKWKKEFGIGEKLLSKVHWQVKPGQVGDSFFVKNLAVAVFGEDTLITASKTHGSGNSHWLLGCYSF
ncbi:hypothetical protein JTE90_008658 [Oedothorax gibbosus]|uniref:Regulatory protein zeste n=1 Tax=Oedothorax gibbosus TaxID=931172 RepID=A0AAV6U1M6_9ARAC|nr:hypothetical protein JTE90_008658 [Oedothorax gibbosus]